MTAATSFAGRARQAWTIAKIELRRVFFAKRSFWVYGLALLPVADLLRARSRGEVPERAACPARPDGPGPDGQRPGGRIGRGREEAAGKAGRGTLVDAEPARPATHRECGDDHPRDRAGGRSPLRPPERHPSFLQRGAGGQDLRVRGLRAGWPGESRAPPSRHWKSAVQPGSGAGEGRERQRGGRPDRQVVRRRPALVPAGGSGSGSSGDALRREARQCGRRKRGVRHPRVQHPGEHGRKDLHHGRVVYGRRVRRGADRVSRASSTSTGGGTARLLFVDGKLQRRDIHRLLDFEEDRAIFAGIFQYFYLRLAIFFGCLGHLHVSLPRGDEQPDAALLVSRAGAARGAARGEVCCRADCVCRDLRRRRPARASRP